MKEAEIQAAIIDYLRSVLPGCVVWACPNAARREWGGRAGNAVPGLTKGAPDLQFIAPATGGRTFFLEVKTPTGQTSSEQIRFHGLLNAAGGRCAVVTGIDDTRRALSAWGIDTREAKSLVGAAA